MEISTEENQDFSEIADDSDVLAVSEVIMERNKDVYEELAK